MALGPFSEGDPVDAARVAAAAAAEPGARLRDARPPPIWVDRPKGTFKGAVLLTLVAALGLALLLYDLGVLLRPSLLAVDGQVTFAGSAEAPSREYWLAVSYSGVEALVTATGRGSRPQIGDHVKVVTHRRYFRAHIQSVHSGNAGLVYVEPEHTLGVYGFVGGLVSVCGAAMAIIQVRLARTQAKRARNWGTHHPPVT